MKTGLTLKDIFSSEVDIRNWSPDAHEDVYMHITMEIGFSDAKGINLFYVFLTTPESLRNHRKNFFLVENRTLVVSEYNYELVVKGIMEILSKCNRETFEESCQVLTRYFDWEYEDYQ